MYEVEIQKLKTARILIKQSSDELRLKVCEYYATPWWRLIKLHKLSNEINFMTTRLNNILRQILND